MLCYDKNKRWESKHMKKDIVELRHQLQKIESDKLYLEECIDLIDYVTLMTVNPGFAGQKMVPDAPQKIRRVRKLLDAYGKDIDIVVDGNTTMENSKIMRDAGANAFVVGTSSIIRGLDTFEDMYKAYVKALEE